MGVNNLRQKVQDYIKDADEQVLSMVNEVLEKYYRQQIVAYHPDGSPMSKTEYESALKVAEKQIREGKYTPVENM